MIKYFTDIQEYCTDLLEIAKLFMPHEEYIQSGIEDCDFLLTCKIDGSNYLFFAKHKDNTSTNTLVILPTWSKLLAKRYIKRYAKLTLYSCLKKSFEIDLPWGALTGIRPTKLAIDMQLQENVDYKKVFEDVFDVSAEKISLVDEILHMQRGLRDMPSNCIDIYVGIPFCVSRCSYCSFTSGEISKLNNYVKPFVSSLCMEIDATLQLLDANNYKIRNVYFGGGTPTSLNANDLNTILSKFSALSLNEFTVEAGRPDTIDIDKLQVMKNCNVGRISVNPQSFIQSTLDIVGRKHTVQDVIDKFYLAKSFGFDINMDLIAGLGNESIDDFIFSVNSAIGLCPSNITIHTLAIKKGSKLAIDNVVPKDNNVSGMVEIAYKLLKSAGYMPYYMYKQKYMTSNLENVGYCKPTYQCLYNIDMMEETTNIIACGCNGVSKRLFGNSRIERYGNPKDVITYINKIETIINDKTNFFANK